MLMLAFYSELNQSNSAKRISKKIAKLIGRVANGKVVNLSLKDLLVTDNID